MTRPCPKRSSTEALDALVADVNAKLDSICDSLDSDESGEGIPVQLKDENDKSLVVEIEETRRSAQYASRKS